MQAIITKVLPATDTKPTRIRAVCARGSMTISYPDADNEEQAHALAVEALVDRFAREDETEYGTPREKNSWLAHRVCGQMVRGGDYCHVFTK